MNQALHFLWIACLSLGITLGLPVNGAEKELTHDAAYGQTMAAQCKKFFINHAMASVGQAFKQKEDVVLEQLLGNFVLNTIRWNYHLPSANPSQILLTVDQNDATFKWAQRLKGKDQVGANLIQKKIVLPLAGEKAILFLTGTNSPETLDTFNEIAFLLKRVRWKTAQTTMLAHLPLTLAGVSAGLIGVHWQNLEPILVPVLLMASMSWVSHRMVLHNQGMFQELATTVLPYFKGRLQNLDSAAALPYNLLLVLQNSKQLEVVDDYLQKLGLIKATPPLSFPRDLRPRPWSPIKMVSPTLGQGRPRDDHRETDRSDFHK